MHATPSSRSLGMRPARPAAGETEGDTSLFATDSMGRLGSLLLLRTAVLQGGVVAPLLWQLERLPSGESVSAVTLVLDMMRRVKDGLRREHAAQVRRCADHHASTCAPPSRVARLLYDTLVVTCNCATRSVGKSVGVSDSELSRTSRYSSVVIMEVSCSGWWSCSQPFVAAKKRPKNHRKPLKKPLSIRCKSDVWRYKSDVSMMVGFRSDSAVW